MMLRYVPRPTGWRPSQADADLMAQLQKRTGLSASEVLRRGMQSFKAVLDILDQPTLVELDLRRRKVTKP